MFKRPGGIAHHLAHAIRAGADEGGYRGEAFEDAETGGVGERAVAVAGTDDGEEGAGELWWWWWWFGSLFSLVGRGVGHGNIVLPFQVQPGTQLLAWWALPHSALALFHSALALFHSASALCDSALALRHSASALCHSA